MGAGSDLEAVGIKIGGFRRTLRLCLPFWSLHEPHDQVLYHGHVLRSVVAAQPCDIFVGGDIEKHGRFRCPMGEVAPFSGTAWRLS